MLTDAGQNDLHLGRRPVSDLLTQKGTRRRVWQWIRNVLVQSVIRLFQSYEALLDHSSAIVGCSEILHIPQIPPLAYVCFKGTVVFKTLDFLVGGVCCPILTFYKVFGAKGLLP